MHERCNGTSYIWRVIETSILHIYQCSNLPIVDDVMEESRPSTQENGRDMAIAPVPIFPTYRELNNWAYTKLQIS